MQTLFLIALAQDTYSYLIIYIFITLAPVFGILCIAFTVIVFRKVIISKSCNKLGTNFIGVTFSIESMKIINVRECLNKLGCARPSNSSTLEK